MKRLVWRLAPEIVLGSLLFFGAGGCDPNQGVKAGPPELLSFSVVDNATGAPVEIESDAGATPVSGFVHLSALFDRLLDPGPITSLDGGMDNGADSNAITVTPALPGGVSLTFTSTYTPNGTPLTISPSSENSGGLVFGPGPTIVTTADPTFPSGATIKATLDKTKVRSKKGEPFNGEAELTFQTLPFAATITVPMAEEDPDAGADAGTPPVMAGMQTVGIAFTNLPAATITEHVKVTVGGTAYTGVTVAPDAGGNPTMYTVTPATTWPANSSIVVTVDATAADALGSATGTANSATFTTGSN